MGGMVPELELGFSLEPGRAPEAGGRDPDTCPGPAGLPVFVSGAPPSDFFRPTPESLLFTLFNMILSDQATRRRTAFGSSTRPNEPLSGLAPAWFLVFSPVSKRG